METRRHKELFFNDIFLRVFVSLLFPDASGSFYTPSKSSHLYSMSILYLSNNPAMPESENFAFLTLFSSGLIL